MDLEGVPRDYATRAALIEQQRVAESASEDDNSMATTKQVTNNFSASYSAGDRVIDINNPPRKRYVHQEFPKLMYHANGQTVKVHTIDQFKASLRKGFQRKPFPGLDYSKISRAGVAPKATEGPVREVEFTAEQLDQLDEAEQIAQAEAEYRNSETGLVEAAETELVKAAEGDAGGEDHGGELDPNAHATADEITGGVQSGDPFGEEAEQNNQAGAKTGRGKTRR